MYYTSSFIQSI